MANAYPFWAVMPLKDGSQYKVQKEFLRELHENYFDVDQELRRMRMWCIANPSKKKTRRGVKRFIVGWLNRGGKLRPLGKAPMLRRIQRIAPEAKPISPEQRALNPQHVEQLKAVLHKCPTYFRGLACVICESNVAWP